MDTVRDDRRSVAGRRDVKPTRPGSRLLNADRAYAEIKRRILDNEMQAGAQFLEQELAALLDMSRTPAREAMVRLADEGMVEIRPRHGMRILPVSAASQDTSAWPAAGNNATPFAGAYRKVSAPPHPPTA